MAREKRTSPRYWLPLNQSKSTPAAVELEGVRYTGFLLDISRTGMAIRVTQEITETKRPLIGHAATGEFLLAHRLHKLPGRMVRLSGNETAAIKFDQQMHQSVIDEVTGGNEGFALWGPSLRVVGVLDARLRRAVIAAVDAGRPIDLSGVTTVNLYGIGLLAAMLEKKATLQGCDGKAKLVFETSGLCKKCGNCSHAQPNKGHCFQRHPRQTFQMISANGIANSRSLA